MTEQKFSSPINLFTAPASTSGPSAFGGAEKNKTFDLSFSRELSRASEQSEPPLKKFDRPSRDNSEDWAGLSSNKVDRSRNTDRAPDAKPDDSSEKTTAANSSASQDSSDKVTRTEEKPTETNESSRKDALDNHDRSKAQPAQSVDEKEADSDEGDKAVSEASVSDSKPVLVDTDVTLEGVDAENSLNSATPEAGVSDAENTGALASLGAKLQTNGVEPLTSVAGSIANSTDMGSPTTQRLTSGEHLSPGQLANRQAHLFKNASMRGADSALPTQIPIADNAFEAESANAAPRSATVASIAAGQLALAVNNKTQKSASVNLINPDALAAKSPLLQAVTDQTQTLQAEASRLHAANAESAENLALMMAAQKSEQQTIKGNLAQALQFAQQQAQSMNLATATASTEPLERANQSTDNTFLSLQGGIVTAPTVTRTDAGSSQAINAPINMPILHNDADKAMAGNIRWMVNEGVKNAVVNVTPNGMGPITVSIGIDKDQMNVSIVALQGATREALDSMLPRLRDQLASQGHDSVRVDISDGRTEQSDRGYGQQFANEQNGSDQDGSLPGSRESDNETAKEPEKNPVSSEGSITFNGAGQIRSRYDVYV